MRRPNRDVVREMIALSCIAAVLVVVGIACWERAANDSKLVVYYSHPSAIADYLHHRAWDELADSVWRCLATSVLSLLLATLIAVGLLMLGSLSGLGLSLIERIAAGSQALPVLVIVNVFLLFERAIAKTFDATPSVFWYCLGPVTLALLFPPLVNGASAISRLSIELKYLLRLWDAPVWARIRHVYIPAAVPDILTGIRMSATWAVGATLITEGLVTAVEGDLNSLGQILLRANANGEAERTTSVFLIATVLAFFVYGLAILSQRWIEIAVVGRTAVAHADYSLQAN